MVGPLGTRMKTALKRSLGRVVPLRLIGELHVEGDALLATAANYCLPSRRRAVSRARTLKGLKIEIGCGTLRHEGWYHVDFRAKTADLRVDVRRGLPFADASARCIFGEHVFEHFSPEELQRVLSECHRVLEPGGTIRIVVPDLESYVKAYCRRDVEWIRTVAGREISPAESLNEVFYVLTHRFIHDFSSISAALHAAGFSEVYRCACGESRFPGLAIDSGLPHRRLDSLYVEAAR